MFTDTDVPLNVQTNLLAAQSLLVVVASPPSNPRYSLFTDYVNHYLQLPPFNFPNPFSHMLGVAFGPNIRSPSAGIHQLLKKKVRYPLPPHTLTYDEWSIDLCICICMLTYCVYTY